MKLAKSGLLQDLYFKHSFEKVSSASEVVCYVCGRGLKDRSSLTAKTLSNGIVLFCDTHYSLQ
jgi:hypothetical protein